MSARAWAWSLGLVLPAWVAIGALATIIWESA